MVNSGLSIQLFDFQERAVIRLLDLTAEGGRQTVVMKAPTGSGKTVILIDYVDKFLTSVSENTAFIWLCPGKGNLEEQSRDKMRRFAPGRMTQNLFEALSDGFTPGSATFINWELVTKRGNTALRDGERKNLFDRIADARRNGVGFIVIIDEEHSNNTARAKTVIDAFAAKHIIRASATAAPDGRCEFFEIDEMDVIGAGLITRALYVNEGMEENLEITDDYDYLLNLADAKRKAVARRYREIGRRIRPLVLIQFPNGRPETIAAVEKKLQGMGYTYDNGLVSKWMDEEKRGLTDNLTENDGIPVFLLMKQAVSTGWDCPRAKILVKLREGMSESFEIQTIGRIRRMPEARHYGDDLLDFCYVYTFDEKYKAGLLSNVDRAYETRRLFLKEKCKTFTLEKQLRDQDFDGLGEREVFHKIANSFIEKYGLGSSKPANRTRLEAAGYVFGDKLIGRVLYGKYVRTDMVMESANYHATRKRVDTHRNGLEMLHCVDSIKSSIGMPAAKVKAILERLFRAGRGGGREKLLALDTAEFYAFIINNVRLLREEFREITADMAKQMSIPLHPKKSTFKIPEQDFFRYDPDVKDEVRYATSAYEGYTSGYAATPVRSKSEMLFEQYCESRGDVDWVYKNGDTGQQYFSIVFMDGSGRQWLFYADYIVRMKDGAVWIMETKSGDSGESDKNMDRQAENKFHAFQGYAEAKNLHWGFVRERNDRLFLNNTVFTEDMSDARWAAIEEAMK